MAILRQIVCPPYVRHESRADRRSNAASARRTGRSVASEPCGVCSAGTDLGAEPITKGCRSEAQPCINKTGTIPCSHTSTEGSRGSGELPCRSPGVIVGGRPGPHGAVVAQILDAIMVVPLVLATIFLALGGYAQIYKPPGEMSSRSCSPSVFRSAHDQPPAEPISN